MAVLEGETTVVNKEKNIWSNSLAALRPLTEKLRDLTDFIKENKDDIAMYAVTGLVILGASVVSFSTLSEMPSIIDGASVEVPMRGLFSLVAGVFVGGLVFSEIRIKGQRNF